MPAMPNTADLSPTRFAELVAPAISRAFISGMRPDDNGRRLVRDHGGPAVGLMIDLRNPLAAGRPITTADLRSLYRYGDPAEVDATMRRSVDHGLLDCEPAHGYRLTAAGRAFVDDLVAAQATRLAEQWGSMGHIVQRLNDLLGRVLRAAAQTGGPAFALQFPPYEPERTPQELVLLNHLSTLRYHRADAHARAWQLAGMTVAEVQAEPWGTAWSSKRSRVEETTNELAGHPFAILAPADRLQLLADLAALP